MSRPGPRPIGAALIAAAVAGMLLTGCAGASPEVSASTAGSIGAVAPEGTMTPTPGSGATPPTGYDVVAIADEADPVAAGLVSAAEQWAGRVGAHLVTTDATGEDEVYAAVTAAVAEHPDLVVGAGAGVVDQLAMLTSQVLDQQFLVLGAQLSEPTENVTAVVWPGAAFRGSGLGASDEGTATSVTAERATEAVEAGVASVLEGRTGIVLALG